MGSLCHSREASHFEATPLGALAEDGWEEASREAKPSSLQALSFTTPFYVREIDEDRPQNI